MFNNTKIDIYMFNSLVQESYLKHPQNVITAYVRDFAAPL